MSQETNVFSLLKEGQKIRLQTWWWGRFIQLKNGKLIDSKGNSYPKSQVPTSNFELYNETDHGTHNER